MESAGDVTGCALSVAATSAGATISCEGGTIHFQNGVTQRITPCSISVPLDSKARNVRVYITGAHSTNPLMMPGISSSYSMSQTQHNTLQIDDGSGNPRGVYPAGLVILGYVEIPPKIKSVGNAGTIDELSPRERASMLRIIRALAEMAKLKDRGSASPVEKQLQALGFDGPKESTIREILKEARDLDPDRTVTRNP